MWHVGIDLHRKSLVMAAVRDDGEVVDPVRIDCQDTAAILKGVERLKPFRAVIEATGTYRWLYELLSSHGTVLLAHPLRLRVLGVRPVPGIKRRPQAFDGPLEFGGLFFDARVTPMILRRGLYDRVRLVRKIVGVASATGGSQNAHTSGTSTVLPSS